MDNLRSIFQLKHILNKLILTAILLSTSAFSANNISPSNDDVRYVVGGNSQNDILVQALKNSQDISFNRFSNFNLTSKSLSIFNGSILSNGSPSNDSSKTIVIQANSINLAEEIIIIGAPADLLFVSPNNISCTQCRFVNVGRVTIANANYSSTSTVGNLSTRTSGTITVNNLTAPGIQSLELIAEKINLAGTINTNFRADMHPEGGMIVSESGAKVIGGGGVNIYPGKFTIDYKTLKINSASATSTHTLSADIQSASIAVTSPNTIILPSGNDLNTANDALSSSVRNGEFYAPLEGIFLTTLKNINASINISGSLITDNSISLKSHKDISLSSSSNMITNSLELIAKGVISTKGIMQATLANFTAADFRNTGNIQAKIVKVDTVNNIFNSYGGVIKAQKITLSAPSGTVTNGSRNTKVNYSLGNSLPITVDLAASVWGIKTNVTNTGATANNLSAHLLASEIFIDCNNLENINPYFIDRPNDSAWDEGIRINNTSSNQVSIQAENKLEIIARNTALNSSALIGLNQEGNFYLNTPKFSNERYHLSVASFKYTQLILSDNKSRQHDFVKTGDATKVTSYSPPGRVYSFGELKFNHVNPSTQSEFINEFSYFEVFKDLFFYKADVKTLGLETGIRFQGTSLQNIRSCIVFQNCSNTFTITSAESETLFSIRGNVYGIDPSLPSQSDLIIDNINVLQVQIQNAIKAFLAPYNIGDWTSQKFSYISKSNVNGDTLTATLVECQKKIIKGDGGHLDDICHSKVITQSISVLLDDVTANNGYEDTGYTYQQLKDAINIYIQTLEPTTSIFLLIKSQRKILSGFNYDNSNDEMTVLYKEETTYMQEVDDRKYLEKTERLYVNRVVSLSTISQFITQP